MVVGDLASILFVKKKVSLSYLQRPFAMNQMEHMSIDTASSKVKVTAVRHICMHAIPTKGEYFNNRILSSKKGGSVSCVSPYHTRSICLTMWSVTRVLCVLWLPWMSMVGVSRECNLARYYNYWWIHKLYVINYNFVNYYWDTAVVQSFCN